MGSQSTEAGPTPGSGEARVSDGGSEKQRALSISKDDAYHLLQNGRRRAAIRFLLSREGEQFAIDELADAVAAWEDDTTIDEVDRDQRQRVYIALYQSHLPKLETHRIIDYDQSHGLITVRSLATALEPLVGDELDADERLYVAPDRDAESENESSGGDFLSTLLGY